MNNDLISIIIPVYKVEDYLRECLDSVIAQTYQNWEAICVDDGSPDNCGVILDEYAKKDKRFVVIHKENGGLSDARNFGLKYAKGKYVAFLDSDDKWHYQLLEISYYLANKYDVDLVNFEFIKSFDEKMECQKFNLNEVKFKIIDNPALIGTYNGKYRITYNVWSKLYKKDLIEGIEFIKKIHFEDYPFTYAVLSRKPKTILSNVKLYFYRMNENSISHQIENPQRIKDYHKGICYIYDIYNSDILIKERAVLKKNLLPRILKQQMKRCFNADITVRNLMWKTLAEELVDLNSKGLIGFRGHRIIDYFIYIFLMKKYGGCYESTTNKK